MALVLAVQHWHSYLLGTKFCVLQQRITNPGQQNWVAKLLGYQFGILYKPGRENRAADALSRRAEDGELSSLMSGPVWVQGTQLMEEARTDPGIQKIIRDLGNDPSTHPGYVVRHNVLYYKDRLGIPRTSKLIPSLLKEFHTSLTGGTLGILSDLSSLGDKLILAGNDRRGARIHEGLRHMSAI